MNENEGELEERIPGLKVKASPSIKPRASKRNAPRKKAPLPDLDSKKYNDEIPDPEAQRPE